MVNIPMTEVMTWRGLGLQDLTITIWGDGYESRDVEDVHVAKKQKKGGNNVVVTTTRPTNNT